MTQVDRRAFLRDTMKYAGGVAQYRAAEGKEVLVPYRGPVAGTRVRPRHAGRHRAAPWTADRCRTGVGEWEACAQW